MVNILASVNAEDDGDDGGDNDVDDRDVVVGILVLDERDGDDASDEGEVQVTGEDGWWL